MTRPLAPLSRRVAAVIIDAAIVAVPVGIASGVGAAMILSGDTVGLILVSAGSVVAVAWTVVFIFMQGGAGSVGQRLVGVRAVDERSGGPIGFGRALLRNLIFGLAGSIVVGYFSVLMDSSGRRQGWHDKVAKSLVVDVRAPGNEVAAAGPPMVRHEPGLGYPTAPQPQSPSRPPQQRVPPPPAPPGFPAAADTSMQGQVPFGSAVPFTSAAPLAQPEAAPLPGDVPGAPVYAPAPQAAAIVPPPGIIAHVPGITAAPPQRLAAAAPPPYVPAQAQAGVGDARRAASLTPTPAPVAPSVELVWDDGTRTRVTGSALFGRDPRPETGIEVVRVADSTLSLSKTHFSISTDGTGAVIVDRASTNGVVIARDGVRTTAHPGEPTLLRSGDLIECGDRWARVETGR